MAEGGGKGARKKGRRKGGPSSILMGILAIKKGGHVGVYQ